MIKVIVSNTSGNRKTIVVPTSTTIRACFEQAGVEYGGGIISVDGDQQNTEVLEQRLGDFATGDTLNLMSVAKLANA